MDENSLNPREKMKAALGRVLRNSRVGTETRDLVFQLYLGTLMASIFRVILEALLIWCVLIAGHYLITRFSAEPPCAAHCFSSEYEDCCPQNPWCVLRLSLLFVVLFAASFVSTKLKSKGKFQHSTMLSALMLLSLLSVFWAGGMPFSLRLIAAVLGFVSIFYGYRFSFLR